MHVFGSLSCFICFKFSVLQFNSCIFFSILPNLLFNPSIKLLIPINVTPFLESNLVLSFDSIYLFNGLATFSYSVAFLTSVILILSTCVRICSLCLVLPALAPSHSPVASLRAVLSLCDLSSREEALLLGQSGMPFLCSCWALSCSSYVRVDALRSHELCFCCFPAGATGSIHSLPCSLWELQAESRASLGHCSPSVVPMLTVRSAGVSQVWAPDGGDVSLFTVPLVPDSTFGRCKHLINASFKKKNLWRIISI